MRGTISPVYVHAFTIARDVDCCFIHNIEQDEITKGKKRLRLESNEPPHLSMGDCNLLPWDILLSQAQDISENKITITPQSNSFMGMLIDLDLAKDSGARQRRTQSHWHDGAHGY
jgi:hypothetical protein